MAQIILVRHGQTAWNREERFRGRADIPLDATGLAQAEATALRIAAQWKPGAVYSGPLSRTVQTASVIARTTRLEVKTEHGLIDVDCGQWEGLTPAEVSRRWPHEFRAYLDAPGDFRFPGGESLEAVRARAMACVEMLMRRNSNGAIVLVSHAAVNRLILLWVLGLNSSGFWKIRQDTCAINVFDGANRDFTLVTWNETGHLLSTYISHDAFEGSQQGMSALRPPRT